MENVNNGLKVLSNVIDKAMTENSKIVETTTEYSTGEFIEGVNYDYTYNYINEFVFNNDDELNIDEDIDEDEKPETIVFGMYDSRGNIVDDLVRENILDKAILGRCRGYVEDRNRVSHKPRNLKKAIELERKLKLDFQTGLRILEELPIKLVSKSYKLKL